jgi:peptidoglycan biosynthesis protein MviN/MurJ (putative lipid II flippase)
MAYVTVFVLFGKLAGAVKEMAFAYRYGVSGLVDTYLFSLTLIAWLPTVWCGVVSSVLVPLATRVAREGTESGKRFFAELSGFAVLLGIALGLLVPLLLHVPWLIPAEFAGSPALHEFLIGLAPVSALIVLCGLASARLLAMERHANTLFEGIPAVFLLTAVLAWPKAGAAPIICGTLAGYLGYLAMLARHLHRHARIERPRFEFRAPEWRLFWNGIGIMSLGQLLMSLTNLVDQYMAAGLGEGAIATLGYSNRILALILGLGATAVARASLPVLSHAVAKGDLPFAKHLARRWSKLLLVAGAAAAVAAWWLAPLIVKLLFERGAFNAGNTAVVARVFRYGVVQLPFYFSAIVLVQLLASAGRHSLIAAGAVLNLVLKTVCNLVFGQWLGAAGIALATSMMYFGSGLFLWLAARSIGRS